MEIKKLYEDAILPTKGSSGAAGLDLYAYVSCGVRIPPGSNRKIGTGIAVAIPTGYFGAVFARSGLATKEGLRPANCVGVIDSDYRGEVIVTVHNDSNAPKTIHPDQRIAQLVVIPCVTDYVEVEELDDTDRGDGGFGSTGK